MLVYDRARVLARLLKTQAFTSTEIDAAMELMDIVLKIRWAEDFPELGSEEIREEVFIRPTEHTKQKGGGRQEWTCF